MRRNWPSFWTVFWIVVLIVSVIFLGPPTWRWYQVSNFPYDLKMLVYRDSPENPSYPILDYLHDPNCSTCVSFQQYLSEFRKQTGQYVWVEEINVQDKRNYDLISNLYQRITRAGKAKVGQNIAKELPATDVALRNVTPFFIFEEQGTIQFAGDLQTVWFKLNEDDISEKIPEYVIQNIKSQVYQPTVGKGDEGLIILQERPAQHKLVNRLNLFPLFPKDQEVRYGFHLNVWLLQFAKSIPAALVPAFSNELFFNPDGTPRECSVLSARDVRAFLVGRLSELDPNPVYVRSAPFSEQSYINEKHLQRNCPVTFAGTTLTYPLVSIAISTKSGWQVWWVFKENVVSLGEKEQETLAKKHETLPVQTSLNPGNPAVEATKVVTVEITVEVPVPVEKPVPVVVTATPVPVVYYSTVVTMTREMREQGRQGLGAWLYAEPFENITPEEEVSLRQGFISFGEVVTLRDYNDSWVVLEVKTVAHDQLGNPYEVIVPRYLLKAFVSGPWQEVQP